MSVAASSLRSQPPALNLPPCSSLSAAPAARPALATPTHPCKPPPFKPPAQTLARSPPSSTLPLLPPRRCPSSLPSSRSRARRGASSSTARPSPRACFPSSRADAASPAVGPARVEGSSWRHARPRSPAAPGGVRSRLGGARRPRPTHATADLEQRVESAAPLLFVYVSSKPCPTTKRPAHSTQHTACCNLVDSRHSHVAIGLSRVAVSALGASLSLALAVTARGPAGLGPLRPRNGRLRSGGSS